MKAKIEITYNIDEIPEGLTEKEIDEFLIKLVSVWRGEWYKHKVNDKKKNVCFNLEITNAPLLRVK